MKIPFPHTLYLPSVRMLNAAILFFITISWQSIHAQAVRLTEQTTVNPRLTPFSSSNQKIVAAVCPFRLPTGQQLQPADDSFKPASAPNYTNILFEVLQTSGWFIPTEYSQMGNLLNGKRDKSSANSTATEKDSFSALQEPTVILEAGLFSHDANTLSDQKADRYAANGVSNRYRQDRATVFIRALSAQSGKVLKTLYWTRTILSQPIDVTKYRYMLVNNLNIIHTGITSVSPDQLIITEAIKQAVDGLIIEGVRDGLWVASNVSAAQTRSVIAAYESERMNPGEAERAEAQPRRVSPRISPSFLSLCVYGGLMRYHGDYVHRDRKGSYGLSLEAYFTPRIGIQLNAASGTLSSQPAFSTNLTSLETNMIIRVMPYWRFIPIVYGGVGMVSRSSGNPFAFVGKRYIQYQSGIGLQYSLSSVISFRALLAYHQPGTDMLDGNRIGSHNDFYVRTSLGLLLHFGQHVSGSSGLDRR